MIGSTSSTPSNRKLSTQLQFACLIVLQLKSFHQIPNCYVTVKLCVKNYINIYFFLYLKFIKIFLNKKQKTKKKNNMNVGCKSN